jgi:hypothetical protein
LNKFKTYGLLGSATILLTLSAIGVGPGNAAELERASLQSAAAATTGPSEPRVAFAAECAAREVKVTTFIEEHGEAGDVAPEKLYGAFVAQLQARDICYEGKVAAALVHYDQILTLAPKLSSRVE